MDRTNAFGDAMTVFTVGPCGGENNYSYIIVDKASGDCAIVDPSVCTDQVLGFLQSEGWTPRQILTTHHHWDHAFGNQRMVDLFPGLEVVGGEEDEVEACTRWVRDGDAISLGQSVTIRCLNTRGHTDGHMSYLASAEGVELAGVFTGDTLFVGGCGRCLEGTPAEMWATLATTLGGLPPETRVFVGHEYTVKNLEFGCDQDPDNAEMRARLEWARSVRADEANGLTVPTTVAQEWKTNVFLRCQDQEFQRAHPDAAGAVEVFAKIRKLKDGKMKLTTEMLRTMDGMIPGKFRTTRPVVCEPCDPAAQL